jgi:tryptophan synthase alpha chain
MCSWLHLKHLLNGFLYLVSSSSTTGKKDGIDGTTDYFKRVQNMKLNSPTLIGFNVKDAASYKTACTYSQGAIIGTAFIRSLNKNNDLKTAIQEFISSIRQEKIENNA